MLWNLIFTQNYCLGKWFEVPNETTAFLPSLQPHLTEHSSIYLLNTTNFAASEILLREVKMVTFSNRKLIFFGNTLLWLK